MGILILGGIGALLFTLVGAWALTQDHQRVSDPTLRAVATELDGTMRATIGCGGSLVWLVVIGVLVALGLAGK